MNKSNKLALTVKLAALTLAASGAATSAFAWRSANHYQDGMTIKTESRHGNGRQVGVVRAARFGWEVRLPRGTWVACRTSCEETLRVETVDLQETQDALTGYGSVQHECGIFGCLEIGYPR
jgi:hypothetical protein